MYKLGTILHYITSSLFHTPFTPEVTSGASTKLRKCQCKHMSFQLLFKIKCYLTVSNGCIASALEDILVAVCPSVLVNEIRCFLSHPAIAILVVVVYGDTVWIRHTPVLALCQSLCTDGIHTIGVDVIDDCPCRFTCCGVEQRIHI